MRTPEQLIDVTVQPIVFLLLFVYVFGRRDQQRFPPRVPAVPAARLLGRASPWQRRARQNLNADIEKGVFDRSDHADRPVGATGRSGAR